MCTKKTVNVLTTTGLRVKMLQIERRYLICWRSYNTESIHSWPTSLQCPSNCNVTTCNHMDKLICKDKELTQTYWICIVTIATTCFLTTLTLSLCIKFHTILTVYFYSSCLVLHFVNEDLCDSTSLFLSRGLIDWKIELLISKLIGQ